MHPLTVEYSFCFVSLETGAGTKDIMFSGLVSVSVLKNFLKKCTLALVLLLFSCSLVVLDRLDLFFSSK